MFRTQNRDMAGLPGMFGEGLSHWHLISRVLRSHYYHVIVEAKRDDRSTEVLFLADSEPQLQQLLVAQDPDMKIVDVQVSTPGWMNGSNKWVTEPLTQVTVGQDQTGCEVYLLAVEDGSSYHSSHEPDFRSDLLTNLRPIFLSTMIRAS